MPIRHLSIALVLLFSQKVNAKGSSGAFTFAAGNNDVKLPNLLRSLEDQGFNDFGSTKSDFDIRSSQLGVELSLAHHMVPLNFGVEWVVSSPVKTEMSADGYQAELDRLGYKAHFTFALSRGFLNLDLKGFAGQELYTLILTRLNEDTENPLFASLSSKELYHADATIYGYAFDAYITAYRRIKIGVRTGIEKSTGRMDFSGLHKQTILGSDFHIASFQAIVFGWAF